MYCKIESEITNRICHVQFKILFEEWPFQLWLNEIKYSRFVSIIINTEL